LRASEEMIAVPKESVGVRPSEELKAMPKDSDGSEHMLVRILEELKELSTVKELYEVVSVNQGCHADVFRRTGGRTDDGRKGVRDLDAL
jgi:hypothetical protein